MPNLIARLLCALRGHEWERRVTVPGKYVSAVTQVCQRCGAGEKDYQLTREMHRRFLEDNRSTRT